MNCTSKIFIFFKKNGTSFLQWQVAKLRNLQRVLPGILAKRGFGAKAEIENIFCEDYRLLAGPRSVAPVGIQHLVIEGNVHLAGGLQEGGGHGDNLL